MTDDRTSCPGPLRRPGPRCRDAAAARPAPAAAPAGPRPRPSPAQAQAGKLELRLASDLNPELAHDENKPANPELAHDENKGCTAEPGIAARSRAQRRAGRRRDAGRHENRDVEKERMRLPGGGGRAWAVGGGTARGRALLLLIAEL